MYLPILKQTLMKNKLWAMGMVWLLLFSLKVSAQSHKQGDSIFNRPSGISGIINDYTPVTVLNSCTNILTVEDATKYNAGDTVLLIQMKGAAIDSSNTSSFGTVTSYNNAGNYEFNYVKSKAGNEIELLNTLINQYDIATGKVQLVRVPYYQIAIISDTLTCLPWDGSKGGIVVLNSATNITLNAPINVSNKGFRGGQVGTGFSCNSLDWAIFTGSAGTKGEGITDYIVGAEAGGAKLSNGGGGAFAANTGGGGGANFGGGGLGGQQYNGCSTATQSIGGDAIDYSIVINRAINGGGGGGGQQDNGNPVAAGGNGGGIIIIKATNLISNNQTLAANGETVTTIVQDEGGAGGGAGGSVLLYVNNYTGALSVEVKGGDGSSNNNLIYPVRCHGPGGGGGGGFIGFSEVVVPAGVTIFWAGGLAGKVLNPASSCFNTSHGAADGQAGGNNFLLTLPLSTTTFKKNIDSVKIKENITTCKNFNFKGLAFTNTNPIQNWQWNFGDGSSDTAQNTTHTYNAAGAYGVTLIVTDINGCKDSIATTINSSGINFDFTFQQNICNPTSVNFTAIGDTTANMFWSLGDGTVINNIRNPAHVFADTGYYVVQYSTGNTTCVDTIKKLIFIGYQKDNIVLTPDTTICFGSSKLLRSNIDSSLNFCWNPASFLDNANLTNPTTSMPSTSTYTLLGETEENNLIANGNFSNGNAGFTSGYLFNNTTPINFGEYSITNSSLNAGLSTDCKDHTGTAGNMLIARSNSTPTATIWKQVVNVVPNTNYIFSIWVQSVLSPNNAQLQLSINGNTALDNIITPTTTCVWKRYFVRWNSGINNTATLAIINKGSAAGSDYFALDDISFASYSIKQDSVKIIVDTPFIKTNADTTLCQSSSVQLNTTGAAIYSWSPVAGLSNAAVGGPLAKPDTTTKYVVTGTNINGCVAKDSVTITVNPAPVVTKTNDTSVCRNTTVPLFATGGISYLWSPANTLNNANSPTPIASPATDIYYQVKVTNTNNCSTLDSVKISIKPLPVFTVSADKSTCIGTAAQLTASGGNFYLWSPAPLVNDPNSSNPVATPNTTTVYSVFIKETTCNDSITLSTTLTVLPLPIINATKSNDINCSVGSATLHATGGLQYNWLPATALNDITSASPVASPVSTTLYTVQGNAGNGCSNTATVNVVVDFSGKATYLIPNAFTPNGDGTNDCFKIKYFGLVQELQFTIFNRWGQKVFFTSNAADCWDGRYKGIASQGGNYIYYIKAKTACGPVEKKGNILLIR